MVASSFVHQVVDQAVVVVVGSHQVEDGQFFLLVQPREGVPFRFDVSAGGDFDESLDALFSVFFEGLCFFAVVLVVFEGVNLLLLEDSLAVF